MSLSAPMLCAKGCGTPVYPGRGQCLAHLADDAPGHPWLPCAGCRRALDRLLGPLAGPEDELCDACAEVAA